MAGRRPETLLAELNRLETLRNPGKAGDQQRQFNRFVVRGDAELHPMSRSRLDRSPIEIKIRDVGRGGLGFICHERVEPGSNWRVHFLQHGYVVGQQALIVRHCRPVSEGLYLVGSQFVADTGLLTTLGVDPGAILDGDSLEEQPGNDDTAIGFLPPSEVA